mmetsp:Transcript_5122/g.15623  ORF Transcript_5122/g.15623 Transcript_5122/m.15623 type:complete len:266 (+) Transcript_5122:2973-3770(+)
MCVRLGIGRIGSDCILAVLFGSGVVLEVHACDGTVGEVDGKVGPQSERRRIVHDGLLVLFLAYGTVAQVLLEVGLCDLFGARLSSASGRTTTLSVTGAARRDTVVRRRVANRRGETALELRAGLLPEGGIGLPSAMVTVRLHSLCKTLPVLLVHLGRDTRGGSRSRSRRRPRRRRRRRTRRGRRWCVGGRCRRGEQGQQCRCTWSGGGGGGGGELLINVQSECCANALFSNFQTLGIEIGEGSRRLGPNRTQMEHHGSSQSQVGL